MRKPQNTRAWRISQETRGQPIRTQGHQITPIGQIMHIRWPGGGLLWHRPLAVEAQREGQTYQLPIYNATRRASLMILLTGLLLAVLSLFWTQRKRL